MNNDHIATLITVLERKGSVRPQGKGWRARCPSPDHEDIHPSFFLYPGVGGRCYSKCARYWSPQELADLLGLNLPDKASITLTDLARVKGLPEEFLRSIGVSDGVIGSGRNRAPCVDISYVDLYGDVVGIHKRLRLDGNPRFIWRRGDRTTLYGINYLPDIRKAGSVILVEGESDCWTLWFNRIPALGLPGASTWRKEFISLLDSLLLYVWHEPDGGGDGLVKAIGTDRPDMRVIEASAGVKDPSDLYIQDPEHFKERMETLRKASRPASELHAHNLEAEAQRALATARNLLDCPDILDVLKDVLHNSGYAGDARPAQIAYVAITSRLLERPLNLAYISQSGAGKNAAVDAILPLFPQEEYYLLRASSPRALVYNDEVFTHRTIILTEADSLPEDGPAASAMRSLMSDSEMTYEAVEKGDDGNFIVRRICKPGPTGLITTSIKLLGDQASTRTLTVSIPDTPNQTRLVLHAQADRSNGALPAQDFSPWVALQRWLAIAGERRIVIPFAHILADTVPATAVRMRRDFAQLLILIKTITFLHQLQRRRDAQGRLIATLDDYEQARMVTAEVFATAISEGVTAAVRETVEAVESLLKDGDWVMEKQLVQKLNLAKSTIHYRVQRGLHGGYLVNQSLQRGAPAQLILGVPLPNGCTLPEAAALGVYVNDPENDSNTRTTPAEPATVQAWVSDSNDILNKFEPGSNLPPSYPETGFERFVSKSVSTTSKEGLVK